jgi:hypothetical protein
MLDGLGPCESRQVRVVDMRGGHEQGVKLFTLVTGIVRNQIVALRSIL